MRVAVRCDVAGLLGCADEVGDELVQAGQPATAVSHACAVERDDPTGVCEVSWARSSWLGLILVV